MGDMFTDTQQQTSTMEIPQWLQNAYQNNIATGQQYAARPYTPYMGETVAGFNPLQDAAFGTANQWGNLGNAALGNSYNALTDTTGAGMAAGAYSDMAGLYGQMQQNGQMMANAGQSGTAQADASLANRGDIRDVNGGSFLDMNVQDYMNPYTQGVSDNVMADMQRMGAQQQNNIAGAASAAGAFGGSRHGVQDAVNQSETMRNYGQMSNQLNNQAYQAATNLMGQDLNRGMQAQLANQGMDWNVGNLNANLGTQTNQFNAGQSNQVGVSNAQMQTQANLANAQNSLQHYGQMAALLGNAGNLGINIGNLGLAQGQALQNFGAAGLAAQTGAGDQIQQNQQGVLDDAYRQWLEARDWGPNNFQYAIGGMPGGNVGGTTSQDVYGPSGLSQGLGAAMAAYGAYQGGK